MLHGRSSKPKAISLKSCGCDCHSYRGFAGRSGTVVVDVVVPVVALVVALVSVVVVTVVETTLVVASFVVRKEVIVVVVMLVGAVSVPEVVEAVDNTVWVIACVVTLPFSVTSAAVDVAEVDTVAVDAVDVAPLVTAGRTVSPVPQPPSNRVDAIKSTNIRFTLTPPHYCYTKSIPNSV